MYVWEKKFTEIIQEIRKKEMIKSFLMMLWFYAGEALNQASLFICMVLQILFLMLTDQEDTITTANILSTLDLLGFIQLLLTIGYKGMLGQSEMQNILLKCYNIFNVNSQQTLIKDQKFDYNIEYTLKLNDYIGFWDKNNKENPVFQNINFQAQSQQVTAVLGGVSSGKTSFLNIFMNEIPLNLGQVQINGKIALAEAEPYIFIGTIRDNIVLDSIYDHEWYVEVLEKCCILEDISKLKNQDQSLVGENSGGVQLSGGQKARISLARAVYQKRDIYLLDDPLSAVDVKVAKLLLKNVIKGLLKDKTVILATHQIDMIQEYVDQVIYLKDKMIFKQGNYQEVKQYLQNQNIIQKQSLDLDNSQYNLQEENSVNKSQNIQENSINNSILVEQEYSLQDSNLGKSNDSQKQAKNISDKKESNKSTLKQLKKKSSQIGNPSKESSIFVMEDEQNSDSEDFQDDQNDNSLDIDEDHFEIQNIQKDKPKIRRFQIQSQNTNMNQSEGQILAQNNNQNQDKIGFQVYRQYSQILGPIIINLISIMHFFFDYYLFIIIFELFGVYQESDSQEKYNLTLKILLLSLTFLISQIIRFLNWSQLHLRGMNKLHTKMVQTIILSTTQYFDKTPIGNILNRFSNDLGVCDIQLFQYLVDFAEKWLQTFVLMAYICYINQYLIIIIILKLFFLIYFYKSTKEVLGQSRQLDLQNKNPIFSLITNTISSISNLNTYGLIPLYKQKFTKLVEDSQRCSYSFWILQRAFALIGQQINSFFGIFIMFFIIFISISQIQNEQDEEQKEKIISNLSIIIVYILKMQDNVPRAIRVTSKIDIGLASFNRINNYLKTIPQENQQKQFKEEFLIKEGQITFKNVSLSFNPRHKPVLNNINLEIQQGEKVAIIGRSGAGKSTIFQAIFRMKEIEDFNDQSKGIFIDQQRIQNYNLQEIRSNISIIPQTPFIYTGTIKFNLDPFNKFDNDKINNLLKEIELDTYLKDNNQDLNSIISPESNLLSIGQKQLICLGRAILEQNKILVIDEATANCDKKTDDLIQNLILKNFKNSTIIAIAHRLETIAGYDKILVLDFGQKVQYDHPYNLLNLQNEQESLFLQMVNQTDSKQQRNIYNLAKKNYKPRRRKINL